MSAALYYIYCAHTAEHLSPLDQVVKLQNFQGSWTSSSTLAQILKVNLSTVNSLNPFTAEVWLVHVKYEIEIATHPPVKYHTVLLI